MNSETSPIDEVKTRIKTYWNERSETFDQDIGHGADATESALWKKYLSSIIGTQPQQILDVGTGTGMIALNMAELGHTVTGIDLGERMLAIAKKKAETRSLDVCFTLGDAENPLFPDNSFDCVICRHLLWTLPHPDKAIREWARVTRPGGIIIAIDGHAQPRNYFPQSDENKPVTSDREKLWHQMYCREVVDSLPYRENLTIDTIKSLFSAENLTDVRSEYITEISEYQKKLMEGGDSNDHAEVQIISGRVKE
nr:methyltransferase domain-containing protein [uncultured Methanospirillum sp.]